MRAIGKKMLATVLNKPKNIDIIEENIYRQCSEDNYLWAVYQIVGIIIQESATVALKTIKDGQLEWKNPIYTNIASKIEEFDNYLVHPFEVVEGVTKCPKCAKSKTWSIQKQTRSSDEPMTTFSRCAECGHEWSYSG